MESLLKVHSLAFITLCRSELNGCGGRIATHVTGISPYNFTLRVGSMKAYVLFISYISTVEMFQGVVFYLVTALIAFIT